jgi:hypothetical protein
MKKDDAQRGYRSKGLNVFDQKSNPQFTILINTHHLCEVFPTSLSMKRFWWNQQITARANLLV